MTFTEQITQRLFQSWFRSPEGSKQIKEITSTNETTARNIQAQIDQIKSERSLQMREAMQRQAAALLKRDEASGLLEVANTEFENAKSAVLELRYAAHGPDKRLTALERQLAQIRSEQAEVEQVLSAGVEV